MTDPGAVVIVLVAVVVLTEAALWRGPPAQGGRGEPGQPDQALLLLQREVETARTEARLAQAETIGSVRLDQCPEQVRRGGRRARSDGGEARGDRERGGAARHALDRGLKPKLEPAAALRPAA